MPVRLEAEADLGWGSGGGVGSHLGCAEAGVLSWLLCS